MNELRNHILILSNQLHYALYNCFSFISMFYHRWFHCLDQNCFETLLIRTNETRQRSSKLSEPTCFYNTNISYPHTHMYIQINEILNESHFMKQISGFQTSIQNVHNRTEIQWAQNEFSGWWVFCHSLFSFKFLSINWVAFNNYCSVIYLTREIFNFDQPN